MRKFALAAISFSAAVFAANYLLQRGSLPAIAGILAVTGIGLAFVRTKISVRRAAIVLLGAAAGLMCFGVNCKISSDRAQELAGQKTEVNARLLTHPTVYDDYCRAEVCIYGNGSPKLRTLVYDRSMVLTEAKPGERMKLDAKFSMANTRYGESYDYYYSKDIYLLANTDSISLLGRPRLCPGTAPVVISRAISDRVEAIFPEDVSAFMKSLMLGDKSDLYEDAALNVSMSRAGLMHIVAVSGMHISFLVALVQMLFGKTRRSSILCAALVWIFVLVTGAGPAAVRAGFMQSMVLAAPMVRRENDPITSLSAALAVILLINPYAATSVSLQLSFAAMAGILCLSERINLLLNEAVSGSKFSNILTYPAAVFSATLGVMAFTVPIAAIHFGYIALLSPITNIIVLWAVSICFCGGYICCLLSIIPLLGTAAAWLIAWLARYIIFAAHVVSSIPFAAVYLRGGLTGWWIVLVYILALISVFAHERALLKLLVPSSLSVLTLCLVLAITRSSYESGTGIINVIDVGQGQCIAVFSGEHTVVIDCGGKGELDNAGETAGEYLKSCGRGGVDLLLLTHLHSDHANGAEVLMEIADVERIIMPEDPIDDDDLLDDIKKSAAKHSTEIVYLSEDTEIKCGEIELQLYAPTAKGDANERCIMTKVSLGDYDMLVTADASKAAEKDLIENHEIYDAELLIVSHHGSRYSSAGEFLKILGGETAVVSVGYNTYSHPANETLERLTAYGYNVYRTDLNGSIEIRIG